MIKIGDYVRFLNEVGGGKVTRIDEKQHLVYVEDEDGFEVPVLNKECVVIEKVNEKTNFPINPVLQPSAISQKVVADTTTPTPKETPEKVSETILETIEGDRLQVLLAFFASDIKNLSNTTYECYLVNDSNYFLFYNFVIGENSERRSVSNGTIEPNIQEFLTEIKKEQLNDWEQLRVQIIPFKKNKHYTEQSTLDTTIKLNTVKFYKLHSFTENDYFDEPSMLLNLVTETEKKQLANVPIEEIKAAMVDKKQKKRKRIEPKKQQPNVLEIDLHINQLLDNTTGLSNADMLQHQLDVFHRTLKENRNRKGQKIVFIHGKGEGVLRKEIEKQLRNRYSTYYFQDASFREYGFGATMVTIK